MRDPWMDAAAIAVWLDRTPRSARELLAALDADGHPVRVVPSRRGHPHREVRRSVVHAYVRGEPPEGTS